MEKNKFNIVEWGMRYHTIIIFTTVCLIIFGIYGLADMNKNEFPDFTIRQGVVIAAAPGYTAQEIEEQVTKPLEDYIFSYKEVKKAKTTSISKDGMTIVQVHLNDELQNKDEFWSKFKHGVTDFKSQLPSGVMAVMVNDDFGDTSALLISMESDDKTYRELDDYMDELKNRLRRIEAVGRMTVSGMQNEQISIYVDTERLSQYGISEQSLMMQLFTKGFATSGGRLKTDDYTTPIYITRSLNSIHDVQELIVFSDEQGNSVRLKDVARVVKEYPQAESMISNNGKKCLLLSIEMKKGKNIVQMGNDVKQVLDDFEATELPDSVSLFKITDQSQIVGDSVTQFLKELLIAIIAVVIVVMLLLPIRVALVASSTIPITIFMSLALFYALGIELNTVTLAALLVTLGMIVDNSIVIIDNYLEKINEGEARWQASIDSATHFFKSIFSATLAISITFLPFLFVCKGMTRDFLEWFPWSIMLILALSLVVAEMLVPYMQYWFIKPSKKPKAKKGFSLLDWLQKSYDWLIALCFRFPKTTILIGVASVVGGVLILGTLPQQMMPLAERNQFAVEIYLPNGTSVEKTGLVADSIEHILRKDNRVLSVASFKGCSSPRFSNSYAPVMGGTEFAQLIINTDGNESTVALLDKYAPLLQDAFPMANVRFKQLGYSEAVYDIEVRLSGEDNVQLKAIADTLQTLMRAMPELVQVHTNIGEPLAAANITLAEDAASRMGLSNAQLESTLAMRYSKGSAVGSVWEGDDNIPVVLKTSTANHSDVSCLQDELIPVGNGVGNVPLRQIASVSSTWHDGQIAHRNGIRTITVMSDMQRGQNAQQLTVEVKKLVDSLNIPPSITVVYGGEQEQADEQMPDMFAALIIAVAIIFVILIFHFKNIRTALLVLLSLSLCTFGTAVGVKIMGIPFGVTCVLGIVSLMGILVRNGIIMIDYAEELRRDDNLTVREAVFHSAERRMRPIFLTSAAASMGVIPMIVGGSGLWMPMGTVIFFGTLITMVFILTVIPVAYWLCMGGKK